jgi:hypothetical protein
LLRAKHGLQGQIVFVALRDIAAGAELTHDGATPDDDDYALVCGCAARTCRKIIAGKDWQRKELQRKYRGLFSWHPQRKIDAGNFESQDSRGLTRPNFWLLGCTAREAIRA